MPRDHIELGLFRPEPKPSAPPADPDEPVVRSRGVESRSGAEPGARPVATPRDTGRPTEPPAIAEPRTTDSTPSRRASDVNPDASTEARIAAPAMSAQRSASAGAPRVDALLDRRAAQRVVDEPDVMTARSAAKPAAADSATTAPAAVGLATPRTSAPRTAAPVAHGGGFAPLAPGAGSGAVPGTAAPASPAAAESTAPKPAAPVGVGASAPDAVAPAVPADSAGDIENEGEGETAGTTSPAQAEDSRGPWLPLVHDLLTIMGDVPVDSEALGLAEFRSQLEAYYHRLEGAASPDVAETIARECVAFCQEFQRKLQSHLTERETEVTDLVRVVEQLVATMSGQTVSIGQLAGSSDRLTRIVEIDDLRILKRRLSLELVTLRRVIDEQRQQHEEHQKRLSGEVALLQKRLDRVREEASLDGLTRIPNRARFDRTLRRWVSMHKHSGQRFVLVMLDVDEFKKINDVCGHPEGDRVLCDIAAALRTHVRSTDLVARYGGDEFVVLLGGADLTHAEQRIRTALARIRDVTVNATQDDGSPMVVSASAGLTEWTVHDSANDVVTRADRALYDAKAEGKGSVKAVARPVKSRLFENGRPVMGAATEATRKVG